MIKIFKKIKNNMACPQCLKLTRSRYSVSGGHSFCRRGFVLLFAVTISAILLTIAIGVTNITLKEIKFNTNARDTNDAFFAADMGIECALMNDKSGSTIFVTSPSGNMSCIGNANVQVTKDASLSIWSFIISGLGSGGQGCAKVTVDKRAYPVVVTSSGYNNGGATCIPGSNTVERQIESRY
jgi:hypothetical protein